jgi:2-polyprenyl-3-methyl-5-hydroxy-6-metoxy-1,4-benzoquinol methylase
MIIECPSCGSLDCGALYPEYSGICITSDMMVLRDATISNRLCRGCGLIFNSGGTRGSTKSFYQNSYSLMMQAPNAAIQSFAGPRPISQAERSFQLLREMTPLPEAGRVLEAGAGKGEFLEHLTAAMPGWNVCAFEPSAAFEVLKERLPHAEVWHCDYQDAAISDNSLDLIVALGVLEHVENPLDMLRWGARLLHPGGIFFLRVPNFANNPNDLFCADHLSKLTAASLRNMAQAAGFEVVGEKEAGVPIFISLRRSGSPAALGNVVRETTSIVERNVESARNSMDAVLRARDAARRSGTNMAIFGLGSSGLFAPMFGGFDPNEITAYIDENKSVWGSRIHDRPVGGLDLISQLSIKHIALAISPVYFAQVREKLSPFGVEVYSA